MRRPLPLIPRGPRRQPVLHPRRLLACPIISPAWELAALRALMKPQMKTAIEHRRGEQTWPATAPAIITSACELLDERLGIHFEPHFPPLGEYFCIFEFDQSDVAAARALAILLTRQLPDLWFVMDRLMIRDGKFFRRRRGNKLELRAARDVHVPRAIRAAVLGKKTEGRKQ